MKKIQIQIFLFDNFKLMINLFILFQIVLCQPVGHKVG